MATTFTVEIDWAKAAWVDETAYVRRVQIRAGFEASEQPVAAPGSCRIVLDNTSQRFSPGNSSSALYGDLLPRREVRVQASDGVTTWTLFRGFIERIQPDAGEHGGGECVLECVDALSILDRQRIGVALADTKDVDQAVSDVVSAAYTPPATDYGDNGDSLAHYGRSWLPERTTAVQALRDICEAVYGRFFIARDGTATYLTRDDRLNSSGDAGLAVGVGDAYWQQLLATQTANLLGFWRLVETSGTDAVDSGSGGYDGTYTGATLAALTGPDGELVPSFDGVNDWVNLYGSGVTAVFDGAEGTILAWFKVSDASVWTSGVRGGVFVASLSGNQVILRKGAGSNTFEFIRVGASTTEYVAKSSVSDTGWVCVAMTWSENADEVRCYWNGVQEGTTQTGLGVWSGTPFAVEIGRGGGNFHYFDGGLALVALWDVPLTGSQIFSLASV